MLPNLVIQDKRDGREVPPPRLRAFLEGYLEGEVANYQMAAFLMAVVFRGMTPGELEVLLDVMVTSGEVLKWDDSSGPVVDKHSTGGVGDKVSLVLAPLAAEMGLQVPMISGRGLGHTTGTLDKLEAIPGFRTDLSLDEFRRVVAEVGVGMIGQTPEIAPLDRRLYELRSVTGTVPSIPLISASIMSKKLAEGLEGLVLDVKVGEGAFLSRLEDARTLARTMVNIGSGRGVRTTALLTAMDRPLGYSIGNALETREAIGCLRGEGPADLEEIVLEEVVEMLVVGCVCPNDDGARKAARDRSRGVLGSGAALGRFARMVEAQGGNPRVIDDPALLPEAPVIIPVLAETGGFAGGMAPRVLGQAVVDLGGGRKVLGDEIDPAVGFRVRVRPGDRVESGQILGEVHARDGDSGAEGVAAFRRAVPLVPDPYGSGLPLVLERIVSEA